MTWEGSTSADVHAEPVAMAVPFKSTISARLSMRAVCRTVRDHMGTSDDLQARAVAR